jgi:hypothetical protein
MMKLSVRRLFVAIVGFLLVGVLVTAPRPAQAQPDVTGQWSTMSVLSPLNPIHVAVLRNGKVLIVGGSEQYEVSSTFKAAVFDWAAGAFSQQTTPWDLFCNGMSFLPDGRVLITGGNISQAAPGMGPPWTTIFDPVTERFYRVEDMARGRWYPSNAPLNDGGTMVFGGLDEQYNTNSTVEIYDVGGGWSPPYQASFVPNWYPRLHLLGNGKVFMSGPNPQSHTFNPATGAWSVGPTTNYGDDRLYGPSVLLPLSIDDGYAPRVVIFGGNVNGATNSVEMIDLTVTPEVWVTKPPLSVPRVTMNAILLPNGKILTVGGSTKYNDPASAHLDAETFDPVSSTWTPSGTMAYARLYHSSALLLPDATVWVAGSNPNRSTWEPHMEIYKPPYLFTSGGAPAPRPAIASVPSVVGYGQSFTVSTPDAASIGKVVLMRPGANTHAFDAEQRLIATQFTKGAGTLTVFAPTSQGAAPPGYYMLFIINASGVPSVARFIQLSPTPSNQPPVATITNPGAAVTVAAGQPLTFASTASDPDGSIAGFSWVFPGGSPARSTAQNPGTVTFATPGAYTVSLTVLDNLGVNNPSPPTVTVTVTGSATLGAAITSPASGATANGTVTVGMAASNAQGSPTQFTLKLDSATTLSTQTIASGSTATYAWNTAGVPQGSHTLSLTVTDGAGRTASTAISVTVPAPSGGGGGGGGGGTGGSLVWTSPVNVTVSGNSITKSGGCSGCWDAGAVSQQTIASGNGSVEFTVSSGASATVGLSNGNAGTNANDITYGLRFYSSYVEVRESGAYKADWPLIAGATHRIAVENGMVKYFQNGVLTYTSVLAPAYPLLVDATIDNAGDAVQNAVITLASGGGGGGGGVGDTTPPAVAVTAPAGGASATATVTVSATASDSGGVVGVQFKLDGVDLGAEDMTAPYSIAWNTTAAANGSHTLTAVARDAAGNTATSAPVTVTVGNGGGGGAGGSQPVVWTSLVNVTASGNSITKSGGCSGCWDAGAVSQQTIASGNGAVAFTVAAGSSVTVGLSTSSSGTSANEITHALRFYPGYVEVRESGSYKSDWPLVAGATHTVAVESGAVKYYQNGVLAYTSTVAPAYPLVVDATLDDVGNAVQSAVITLASGGGGGGGLDDPPPPGPSPAPAGSQNVVWTSAVNVTVSGTAITKNAGCNGCWDAGASSQQTITAAGGSVEFTLSAGAGATVGLSAAPAGTNGNDITYGLRFYPGSPAVVEVREGGAYKWDWIAAAGAVYKIAVAGNAVTYFQNGTPMYTSAAPPTYPLVLDATLDNVGHGVQNATIGP